MLTFNHKQRPSIKKLMKCKLFDDIRSKMMERDAPYSLKLKFDQSGSYDYEQETDNLGPNEYVALIEDELKKFYLG